MNESRNTDVNALINKVRENDNVAFSDLVNRYTPLINKVVSGFHSNTVRVDESFSEACVALYNAAISYDSSRGDITFGLYARICIYRRLCDFFGKDKTVKYALLDDVDVEAFPVLEAPESDILSQEILDNYLARAREILSDYEFRVFVLYLEGYSTADIADELQYTAKSVDNAKARLFRRLRQHRDSFPRFD